MRGRLRPAANLAKNRQMGTVSEGLDMNGMAVV
jgi:hypothetical protein